MLPERRGGGTRERETGQQRLLDVIGTTARLEERPDLEMIRRGPARTRRGTDVRDPRGAGEGSVHRRRVADQEVVYLDVTNPNAVTKVRLGPIVITGDNIDRASASLAGAPRANRSASGS